MPNCIIFATSLVSRFVLYLSYRIVSYRIVSCRIVSFRVFAPPSITVSSGNKRCQMSSYTPLHSFSPISHRLVSHRIVSCRIVSFFLFPPLFFRAIVNANSHHICHFFRFVLQFIVSYRILSYRIVPYRVVSCRIVSLRVFSSLFITVSLGFNKCQVASYTPLLSFCFISYRIVSYRIAS